MVNECTFGGCDRQVYAVGLCRPHYIQRRKGNNLTPIRQYNRVHDGKKKCTRCGEVKTLDNYTFTPEGYPTTMCRPCTAEREKAAYHANKNKVDSGSTTITGGSE